MLISIIIPCYQQEIYLERALDSIQEQKYTSIEVIVVDDGSIKPVVYPDKNYSFPLKLVRQSNQGLSAARNTGIRHASGCFVKFLDADDKLLPGCISAQVSCINANYTNINVIGFIEYDEDTLLERHIIPAFGDPLSALMMDNLAPMHCYLFPKSALIEEDGFSTNERASKGCEDYDLVFRLAIAGYSFSTLHQEGVVYYRRSGTMSKNIYNMQQARVNVWIYNVSRLLNKNCHVIDKHIMSIISGLAKIYPVATKEHSAVLSEIIMTSCRILGEHINKIPSPELVSLLKIISNFKHLRPIYECIEQFVHKKSSTQIHINSTSINDYRLFLDKAVNQVNGERVIYIFEKLRMYQGAIGIYGAGELGSIVYRICSAAGHEVTCFIDKAAPSIKMKHGLPVYSPSDIKYKGIEVIIISSSAFYDEIYESIKNLPCEIF